MTQPPSRSRPVFHDSGDPLEDAKGILQPQMAAALTGMQQLKFTTGEFVQGYRRARGGEPAYQHALAWLSLKQGNRRGADVDEFTADGLDDLFVLIGQQSYQGPDLTLVYQHGGTPEKPAHQPIARRNTLALP